MAVVRRGTDSGEGANGEFWGLVDSRKEELRAFLRWAAGRELDGSQLSVRFSQREDIKRCRESLGWFEGEWWGVLVYSCFDSLIGTKKAASRFRAPVSVSIAQGKLESLTFPPRSVQFHRSQATLKRAKSALLDICLKHQPLRHVLQDTSAAATFENRFARLQKIDVDGWGRTTCFDVLVRAGSLPEVDGGSYRPASAQLFGSTGPSNGFRLVWGRSVSRANAESCEMILTVWAENWGEVARRVELPWESEPFDCADLENALCVYQEKSSRKALAAGAARVGDPKR